MKEPIVNKFELTIKAVNNAPADKQWAATLADDNA